MENKCAEKEVDEESWLVEFQRWQRLFGAACVKVVLRICEVKASVLYWDNGYWIAKPGKSDE